MLSFFLSVHEIELCPFVFILKILLDQIDTDFWNEQYELFTIMTSELKKTQMLMFHTNL